MNIDIKRIDWLDIAKGIAILSIIMVHFPGKYRPISQGITWHVSIFFSITGILLFLKSNSSITTSEVKKDFINILWPYISLSIIYIVLNFIVQYILNDLSLAVNTTCENIFLTISGVGIGTLWFLPTLFIAKTIYRFLFFRETIRRSIFAYLVMCVSLICAYFLNKYCKSSELDLCYKTFILNLIKLFIQSGIAVGFMEIGINIYYFVCLIEKEKKKLKCIFFFLGLLFLVIDVVCFKFYDGNDLRLARICNPFEYLICSIFGIVAIIFLSCFLQKIYKNPIISFLIYCGKNSLIIMTTHLEYRVVSICIFVVFLFLPNCFITKCLAFLLVCIIEIIICELVNRTFLKKVYFLNK